MVRLAFSWRMVPSCISGLGGLRADLQRVRRGGRGWRGAVLVTKWIAADGGVRPRQGRGLATASDSRSRIGVRSRQDSRSMSPRPRSRRGSGSTSRPSHVKSHGAAEDGPVLGQTRSGVAVDNGQRPKPCKLVVNTRLRARVEEDLGKRTPRSRSRPATPRLPRRPGDVGAPQHDLRISLHPGQGALRADLAKCLRSGRIRRRPRRPHGYEDRRGTIPDKVMITERPVEVDDRAIPGHWEAT